MEVVKSSGQSIETSAATHEEKTITTADVDEGCDDDTPSDEGCRDSEASDNGNGNCVDHNPEPPPELLEKGTNLIGPDNIGDTVFSKHWLFTTLMRLIEVVEADGDSKEGVQTEAGVDVDENLQDELCRLWDMSMNSEVVTFLQEFKAVDILTGAIAKSKAPRATEICIGILGNMGCNMEASKEMAANDKLIQIVLLLLSDPDAPTLVETMRLLLTAISNIENCAPWLEAIKSREPVFTDITFILASSTNNELLRNTAMFVDKLLDVEEGLCVAWAKVEFVSAVTEAMKQIGVHQSDALDALLHTLQLVSTSQPGVQSLLNFGEEVCSSILSYLVHVCADDLVPVEGNENSLASALSTLNIILMSSQDYTTYIFKDFQLIRCLLKVLEVTYPKVHDARAAELSKSRRRKSTYRVSLSETSPVRSSDTKDQVQTADIETSVTETQTLTESDVPGKVEGRTATNGDNVFQQGEEFDRTRMKMLYEVIRGFVADMMTLLKNGSDADAVPKTLEYMNSMCPRERLYVIVWTLDDVDHMASETESQTPPDGSGSDHQVASTSQSAHQVAILQAQSQIFHLDRLHRIVKDAMDI